MSARVTSRVSSPSLLLLPIPAFAVESDAEEDDVDDRLLLFNISRTATLQEKIYKENK